MQFDVEGHVSDPTIAWERLGDTDFMNRIAGNSPLKMRLEPGDVGGAPKIVGELSGPLGMSLPFVEDVNAWVFERWFKQDRTFRSSPIARSRFQLRLESRDDGVVPHLHLELQPAARLLSPLLASRIGQIRKGWQGALDALPRPGDAPPPATERVLGADAEAALARWATDAPSGVVAAVAALFREGRATELQQLRAFSVADRFTMDRHETLLGMLRGVRAGALEVYWSVRCQRCRSEVGSARSLSDLADHAGCPSCRIDFDTDLSVNVEVLFAPHPGVISRVEQRFCTVFPSGAPALRCAFLLAPGESVDEEVALAPGRWLLGEGGEAVDVELSVGASGAEAITWEPGATGAHEVRSGAVKLSIRNEGETSRRVVLAEADPRDDVVPASLLATLPEFRRELSHQVLSPNIRIGSRSVALLFTDLSGSTALYEAIGDAAAYALVRDHFQLLTRVVEAHRGTVVKTIGDAVMASFHTAGDAVDAALEMRDDFGRWAEEQDLANPPRLNLGVHVGPALAIHSDASGVDWFGRTVNVAARAQGAAQEGALVLTRAVHADERVRGALAARSLEAEAFEADAKGLGRVQLFRIGR